MSAYKFFLSGLLTAGAVAVACTSPVRDFGPTDPDGGEGGQGGDSGTPQDSDPVIGVSCDTTADCELEDDVNCSVTCEDVEGEKRCVTTSVDADEDGFGSAECAAAPGADCNDADERDAPDAPALVATSAVDCGAPCSGLQSIAWTNTGEPLLVWGDPTEGSSGEVYAQRLDETGTRQGDVTTWIPALDNSAKLSRRLSAVRKDSTDTFGLLFGIQTTSTATTASGVAFSEGLLDVVTQDISDEVVMSPSTYASYTFQLDRASSSWSIAGSGGYTSHYTYIGDATGLATRVDPPRVSRISSALIGSTRGIVGLNQSSNNNPDYDPALQFHRFSTDDESEIGAPVVVINNLQDNDISPMAGVAAVDGDFVVFYRDEPTDVPLSAIRFDTDGAKVGEVKTYTSEIVPLEVQGLASGGGIIIGRTEETDSYSIVAQRFDDDLEFVGDELRITTMTVVPNYAKLSGESSSQAIVFSGSSTADEEDGFRLLHVNACR